TLRKQTRGRRPTPRRFWRSSGDLSTGCKSVPEGRARICSVNLLPRVTVADSELLPQGRCGHLENASGRPLADSAWSRVTGREVAQGAAIGLYQWPDFGYQARGLGATLMPYFANRQRTIGSALGAGRTPRARRRRGTSSMTFSALLAPVRPARRAFAIVATASILAVAAAPIAFAQQPAPARAPAPAPKAAPKPAPKAAPKQPAPQAQPAQPAQPQQQQSQGQGSEQMPVIYSPWTKFCGKDQNQANAKEVCLTVKEARLETGQFLAGAPLIDQAGEDKKIFRITLPLGMQLP